MNHRFIPPAVVISCLVAFSAAAQLSAIEKEALRQRYGIAEKSYVDPKSKKRISELVVSGVVERWVAPNTVLVVSSQRRGGMVKVGEIREKPQTGGSTNSAPVVREIYEGSPYIEHWSTVVAGVATGSVKPGDKVRWLVKSDGKKSTLVGPAK